DIGDLLFANKLNITTVEKVLAIYFLEPAAKALELLGIVGPITIKIDIIGSEGLEAILPPKDWFADSIKGPSPLYINPTSFIEESSTEELLGQRDQLLVRLVDRIASAFGMWR